MPRLHIIVKAAVVALLGGVLWVAGASLLVVNTARGRTYSDPARIPLRHVGLVLGCSRLLPDGRENGFFAYRIEAAARLFHAGKVDYLVVSGDNHVKSYDEPRDMKESLIAAGVPPERIFCDYAGRRTLDSVMRVRDVFSQNSVTIISQKFHNERAIFIARHAGFDAIGFNAGEVDPYYSFKTKCREVIARANMLLDLYVFHRAPKFLGPRVAIPE